MAELPYVTRSACKHGATPYDVRLVLAYPDWVLRMPLLAKTGAGEAERPNVDVYGGYDTFGQPLVVFVDRFENIAFDAEPGDHRFGSFF